MRTVNDFEFYQLGSFIHPLTDADFAGKKVSDAYWVLYQAEAWLDYLLSGAIVPIEVCKSSATQLLSPIRNLTKDYPANADTPIPDWRAWNIKNAAKEFEIVFSAELQRIDTYFVSQTGIYKTPDLIERAEQMFPETVRKQIPDHAVKDIREAGRCLAFNLNTAAGFHLLRAAEVMIVTYLTELNNPPKFKSRNWGRYISVLKKTAGANLKIAVALDQIREMHRNPLMHPEDALSEEEALALLGVIQGVIVSLAAEIGLLRSAKAAASAAGAAPTSAQAAAAP